MDKQTQPRVAIHSFPVAAALLASVIATAGIAQTPNLKSDGGGSSGGGGKEGSGSFGKKHPICAPENVTTSATKPVNVRAYTSVSPSPFGGGLKRHCVTPLVVNGNSSSSPAPLRLWLTDHRAAMASNDFWTSSNFIALKLSPASANKCESYMGSVPASASEISATSWCFDSFLPQPSLGVYLGVPVATQPTNGSQTMKTATRPNTGLPTPSGEYAAYCRLEFSTGSPAPTTNTAPTLCAPISNPRFRFDSATAVSATRRATETEVTTKSQGNSTSPTKLPVEVKKP